MSDNAGIDSEDDVSNNVRNTKQQRSLNRMPIMGKIPRYSRERNQACVVLDSEIGGCEETIQEDRGKSILPYLKRRTRKVSS